MEGNEIEEPKLITPFKSMPLSTRNLYGSAQKKKIAFTNEEENGPGLKRSNS